MINRFRRGHTQYNSFNGQQTAWLQRVASERHRKAENEFAHQQPPCDERPKDHQHDGIHDQKQHDGQFVPLGGMAEKIMQY